MTQIDDALIEAHASLVYATCLRITGNAHDAADASQEVFLAWMNGHQRIRGPVGSWLHATARRRSLDHLRRGHRRARHVARTLEDAPAPQAPSAGDDWRAELDDCLVQLPVGDRTVLIERFLLGHTQEDIAVHREMSQSSVSRTLDRALRELRRLLARRGVDAPPAMAVAILQRCQAVRCPPGVLASLEAHSASLAAGISTAGPAAVWWMSTSTLAGAASAVVAMSISCTLAWRWGGMEPPSAFQDQPPASVAAILARYPAPAPGSEVRPPAGKPRYHALETLIGLLPRVDEARQERIDTILTGGGRHERWRWPTARKMYELLRQLGVAEPYAVMPATLSAEQEHIVEDFRATLQPLLRELLPAGAFLGEAGWLARDYREGRIPMPETAYRSVDHFAACVAWMLQYEARRAADPTAALVDLDCFVRSCTTAPVTLWAATVVGRRLDIIRDTTYLRLALDQRLPAKDLARWAAEPPVVIARMELAWRRDPLLGDVLSLESMERSGAADRPAQVVSGAAPTVTASWQGHPWTIRSETVGYIDYCLRLAECVRGGETWAAICKDMEAAPYGLGQSFAISGIDGWNAEVAQDRLGHSARRLAALLADRLHRGMALPARLDDVPELWDALTDGRALLGGSATTYGVRYWRLSDVHFRLDRDPGSPAPVYQDAQLQQRRDDYDAGKAEPSGPFQQPVKKATRALGAWSWDVDLSVREGRDGPAPPVPVVLRSACAGPRGPGASALR